MSPEQDRCPACFVLHRTDVSACPHCGHHAAAPASPLVLAPGTVLADDVVAGAVLGEPGGFGTTYLGWDRRLEKRVAIKEYLPRDLATRGQDGTTVIPISASERELLTYGRRKFLEEARTLARFDHPNLVRVRTFFEANATGYLIMDYYEGVTLAGHLSGGRAPMDEELALGAMLPVLDGLREVHSQNVLHRDIKPQNIYLTTGGRPILLDFGAARVAMNERSRSLSVVLTPGFAPYEQYHRSGRQGPWTDVYACASTLYWMLTGRAPPDALERLVNDELRPPHELRPELSPEVSDALVRGLAVEPDGRLQSVREFQDLLLGSAAAPSVPTGAPRLETPRPEDGTNGVPIADAAGEPARGRPELTQSRLEPAAIEPASRSRTTTAGRWAVASALVVLLLAAGIWALRSGTAPTPDAAPEEVAVAGADGADTGTDSADDGAAGGGASEGGGSGEGADTGESEGSTDGADGGAAEPAGPSGPAAVAGACSTGAADRALRQVRDQLASAERELGAQLGLRAVRSPYCERLTPGEAGSVPADLEASRRYIAVGVCDGDCSDVDVEMRDPASLVLSADRAAADFSFVMFAAPVTGEHRARVGMAECAAPYCAFGLALYEVTDEDPWADGVRARMEELARTAAPEVGIALALPVRVGYLWEGGADEMSVRLDAGRSYVVVGMCDEDCGDLDLAIDDSQGRTVDSDVETDALPVLEFTSPGTGEYWIRPTMYACSDEPCRYGVGLFTKAGG